MFRLTPRGWPGFTRFNHDQTPNSVHRILCRMILNYRRRRKQRWPHQPTSEPDVVPHPLQHGCVAWSGGWIRVQLGPHGRSQLPGRQEDRVRKLWRAEARQKLIQQRARGHQARANEVKSTTASPRIQVLIMFFNLGCQILDFSGFFLQHTLLARAIN